MENEAVWSIACFEVIILKKYTTNDLSLEWRDISGDNSQIFAVG